MATNKLQWKRIANGDRLPCQSFLRKKDGEILKLSTIGGVTVGQDCYYLPVDEVINVIKDYPVEESEDERIINNIRKVIGWYRGMFTEKKLMPEQYQEIDAWLDKKGERKHQYKSRPRYVGEGELLGKKESTVFSGDENIRKALVEMVHDTVGDSLWVDYNVHKEDAIAWIEKQGEQKPILDVEIPFGAKDSELEEVTYDIPKGYYAEIDGNKVVIKKGEQKPAEWSEEIEAAISLLKDIAEEQEKDYCPHNANDLRKAAIYLETCRSQSTLKPSDKHYELEEFARVVRGNLTGISKTVQKLFEAKYLQLTGRKMYIGFKD